MKTRSLGLMLVALGIILLTVSIAAAQVDVTESIKITQQGIDFDKRAGMTTHSFRLRNMTKSSIPGPFKAVINAMDNAKVSILNPDGWTSEGKPYFLYNETELDSKSKTRSKKWTFKHECKDIVIVDFKEHRHSTFLVQKECSRFVTLFVSVFAEGGQNHPPVADAGPDQTVFVGSTVMLDGSTSSDVDGDLLTFRWSFTSFPPESIATLSDPAAVKPTFAVDLPGNYVIQLIVNDGKLNSGPDTVSITVSPRVVIVPAVAELTQSAADSAITAAHLTVGTITLANSSTVPAGSVISQNPLARTSVSEGTAINLVISLGPSTVMVPSVMGMAQAAAETTISVVGLTVGSILTANSTTAAAGNVISQSPAAGSSVSLGSTVNLIISLGPPIVTVPNVIGLTQDLAQSTIIAAGLIVGKVTFDYNDTVPAGNVISQSPAGSSSIALNSSVNLIISQQIPAGATTARIGPSGGTITDPGGASLYIPPGALTQERLISILTHTNSNTLPAPAPFIGGADFGPDGLIFEVPVTITFPLSIDMPTGTILSIFQYDATHRGWLYTSFHSVVNPDMKSASAEVTHFTDYVIIMGIDVGQGDPGLYFGSFHQRFTDICNPTPTADLFSDMVFAWSHRYFPVGEKLPFDFSAAYPTRGYECYEITGIQFVLSASRAVPDPNAPPPDPNFPTEGGWIETEDVNIPYLVGSQSDLQVVFDASLPAKIFDSTCGEQQLVWNWTITVYFGCTASDIVLNVGTRDLYVRESTPLKAKATCGTEPMKGWPVNFQISSSSVAGSINPSQERTNENGETNPVVLTAGCDGGIINVSGLQQICMGTWEESSYNSNVVPINVTPRVSSLQVNPPAVTLSVGQASALEAIPLDAQGTAAAIDPNTVTWSSSNLDVAWASPSIGLLTLAGANNVGISTISAIYGDQCGQKSGQTQVTVNCDLCTFQITPSRQELALGENPTILTVELRDIMGRLVNILPPSTVTWTGSSSIVSLSTASGTQTTLTPVAEGEATITAIYTDMFSRKTATAVITVTAPPKSWHKQQVGSEFYNIEVVADGSGNTYAAWSYTYEDSVNIGKVDSNGLTPIAQLSGVRLYDSEKSFFVDKAGKKLFVVYWEVASRQVNARWYNIDSGWDSATILLANNYSNLGSIDIAADDAGNTIVVRTNRESTDSSTWFIRSRRYNTANGWEPLVTVAQEILPVSARGVARIGMDSMGNAIVVWSGTNASNYGHILAKKYAVDSGWDPVSIEVVVSPLPTIIVPNYFLMDRRGNAIMTWEAPDTWMVGLGEAHYNVDTGWSSPTILIPADIMLDIYDFSYLLSMDENGNAMLVFEGREGLNPVSPGKYIWSKGYSVDKGWDADPILVAAFLDIDNIVDDSHYDIARLKAFAIGSGGNATLTIFQTSAFPGGPIYGYESWVHEAYSYSLRAIRFRTGKGWDVSNSKISLNPESVGVATVLGGGWEGLTPLGDVIDIYGNVTAFWLRGSCTPLGSLGCTWSHYVIETRYE